MPIAPPPIVERELAEPDDLAQKPRRYLRGFLIGVLVICMSLLGTVIVARSPRLSAYVADDLLRPVIGDRGVVRIESVLFDFQDRFDRARHRPPSAPAMIAASASVARRLSDNVPASIKPQLAGQPSLTGEGVWREISPEGVRATFVRTDPDRPYAIVSLVRIPMQHLKLGIVAGREQPGGSRGIAGPGQVPGDLQRSGRLVATFNGGFRYGDGHYGMSVGRKVYVPLSAGVATTLLYRDGHAEVTVLKSRRLPDAVIAARQNGPLLVIGGRLNPLARTSDWMWGGNYHHVFVTWRSGLGVLPSGDIVWAGGPSLTPKSLGRSLLLAGAVNAMELDINNYWVRFTLYNWCGHKYKWHPLNEQLPNEGGIYLDGNKRDFFYVYE